MAIFLFVVTVFVSCACLLMCAFRRSRGARGLGAHGLPGLQAPAPRDCARGAH
jgi:hypothetical protein